MSCAFDHEELGDERVPLGIVIQHGSPHFQVRWCLLPREWCFTLRKRSLVSLREVLDNLSHVPSLEKEMMIERVDEFGKLPALDETKWFTVYLFVPFLGFHKPSNAGIHHWAHLGVGRGWKNPPSEAVGGQNGGDLARRAQFLWESEAAFFLCFV